MRKNFFSILFIFCIILNVFSDEKVIYKTVYVDEWGKGDNLIEINFMYPGLLSGVRYERKLDDNLSIGLMAFYNVAGNMISLGGRLENNFYIHNHSLNSFFTGPFLSIYNLNGGNKSGLFFGAGINIGYRWIFNNLYCFSPRVTFQYGIGPESEENIRAGASGFSYGVGISGGIVF
ncbi:MAG: hypothetical protein N3E50_00410 [Candidatus Goldbacteria bacterium]|nr:hypothetical protein [Candidatus Goldiibacteriota bacterium]